MPTEEFMSRMQPAVDAYASNYVNAPPDPNAANFTPANLPVASSEPLVSQAPPPPPPAPLPPAEGGFTAAPPAPVSIAGPGSYLPPPSPPPVAPAPPGLPKTALLRGAGALPAHEQLQVGPTSLALNNQALEQRVGGVGAAESIHETQAAKAMLAARVREDDADKRVADAAALQAAQQKSAAEANQKVQDATKATQNVAPITDYWADRSTFQHMGNAIAIGLAGMGQAISRQGGPNPVMQMLQADMDRDLRTKQMRFEQQTKGAAAVKDAAQQHFDNMVRQFGLEPATQIMAAAQRDKVAAQIDQEAAGSKFADQQANGAKMAADLRADANDRKAGAIKLIQATKGEDKYLDPELGVEMTRKEYAEYRAKQSLQGQELAGKAAAKGGDHADENRRFIADKLQQGGFPQTESLLNSARKATQAAGDKGTGVIATEMWKRSPVLFEKTYGPEATAREQAFQALANADIHNTSGGAVSADEWVRNSAKLYGAKDKESREQVLDSFADVLNKGAANIKAGGGLQAAQEYDANRQALAPPPIKFKPSK